MDCDYSNRTVIYGLVKYGCVLAFLVQMSVFVHEQIHPSLTFTSLEEKKLEELDEFPVIFKICHHNSFNLKKVKAAGYSSVSKYFLGRSYYNNSMYGWGGHHSNGSIGRGVAGRKDFANSHFFILSIYKFNFRNPYIHP